MTEAKKYEVIDASPKALSHCVAEEVKQGERDVSEANAKYPFKSLRVGESFAIPFDDMGPGTLQSVRSSASLNGKKLQRKFKIITHDDYRCVEVARIK